MGRDETTKEKKKHLFCNMKTKSLAFIAGIIWLIAGFNVYRIGVDGGGRNIHLYFLLPQRFVR